MFSNENNRIAYFDHSIRLLGIVHVDVLNSLHYDWTTEPFDLKVIFAHSRQIECKVGYSSNHMECLSLSTDES